MKNARKNLMKKEKEIKEEIKEEPVEGKEFLIKHFLISANLIKGLKKLRKIFAEVGNLCTKPESGS